jgi:hypothetical protein
MKKILGTIVLCMFLAGVVLPGSAFASQAGARPKAHHKAANKRAAKARKNGKRAQARRAARKANSKKVG